MEEKVSAYIKAFIDRLDSKSYRRIRHQINILQIVKIKFKQRFSVILLISIKRTTTSHIKSLDTKNTFVDGNPCLDLEHTQKVL